MRRLPLLISLILILAAPGLIHAHTVDLAKRNYISFPALIDILKGVRLVFIGELHDNAGHHRAQLQVIRALHDSGVPVTIALEMVRHNSQAALDAWVSGSMTEPRFQQVFEDNWGMWPYYRDIFQYARAKRIPMLGLNIERGVTQRVARNGFGSLSPDQRAGLPLLQCNVDPKYQDYLRRVLGKHGQEKGNFQNFCEAQMVWDVVMAKNLLEYLGSHPPRVVVVLSGSGHAWKFGIPEQIRRHVDIPQRILLPEIPGRIEMGTISSDEADFLMLGTEDGPLH